MHELLIFSAQEDARKRCSQGDASSSIATAAELGEHHMETMVSVQKASI
jgi:hypothetical protein